MRRIKALLPTIAVVIGFALVCLGLRIFLFHAVRIEGTSMVDTLRSGDIVLVSKADYLLGEPDRGDIVECSFPGRSDAYIKRIIGLPGERIEIIDSRIYVDGKPLSEPYATGPSEDYSADLGADEYLVLGDNRSQSYDSRAEDMGFIRKENLLGRVRFVIWPFRKIS